MELDPYGRCYTGSCYVKDSAARATECPPDPHNCNTFHPELDGPVTGNGYKAASILDLPKVKPETCRDYLSWVKFRVNTLERMIRNDEDRLALETIARIEGDLQQIRLLLKSGQKLAEG